MSIGASHNDREQALSSTIFDNAFRECASSSANGKREDLSERNPDLNAVSATCGATRRRQMRDVRYDCHASGDDQNQRKDYCDLRQPAFRQSSLITDKSGDLLLGSENEGSRSPSGSRGMCRDFCLATTDPLTVVSRGYGRIDDRAVSRLG